MDCLAQQVCNNFTFTSNCLLLLPMLTTLSGNISMLPTMYDTIHIVDDIVLSDTISRVGEIAVFYFPSCLRCLPLFTMVTNLPYATDLCCVTVWYWFPCWGNLPIHLLWWQICLSLWYLVDNLSYTFDHGCVTCLTLLT